MHKMTKALFLKEKRMLKYGIILEWAYAKLITAYPIYRWSLLKQTLEPIKRCNIF